MAKALLKGLVRSLVGDYGIYRIFAVDLPQAVAPLPPGVEIRPIDSPVLEASDDPELRARAWYGGAEAQGFGLYADGELAAIQWYWWGERYRRRRNSWPLGPGGAKSVELYTRPQYRGRGYAALLKLHTAEAMAERGFRRLYSRIWHSNGPSIRVSEKTGWRRVGTYIELHPLGRKVSFRLPF
ncbi:MAG TPA: GNAT family N-acetyltransferase [Sphingomonadales bacterium]